MSVSQHFKSFITSMHRLFLLLTFHESTPSTTNIHALSMANFIHTEKKKRAKIALLESNFENRLSFVDESRFFYS